MRWIIENFANEISYNELIEAVKNNGHDLHLIRGDFKYSDLEKYKSINEPVIFCGSITMTNLVLKDLSNCFPVAYNTCENYLCTKYCSHFGEYLFNDKYAFISLKEFQRQRFHFYGMYGKEGLIFIRPNSGQKTFQAQLLDIIDLDRFVEQNKDVEHELVMISTPKNILWEGRFIVSRNKEIIASSTYQFQGQRTLIPAVPEKSTKLCQQILNTVEYYPDSVFVMDLCEDSDKNYWLLELNSFSSAGLYASDKNKIVKRVSEIASEDYRVSNLQSKYALSQINPNYYNTIQIGT